MNNRFSLHDMVEAVISNHLQDVYTSLPARVLAYYPEEQLVDVRPLIRFKPNGYGKSLQQPVVYRVPVIFPSCGGMLFSARVKSDEVDGEGAGDTVQLQFSMRSMAEWVESEGEDTQPASRRTHSSSDAVAIVGLYTARTNLQPDPVSPQWKYKDTIITLEDDGTDESNLIIETNGQTGITINVNNGNVNLNAQGNLNASVQGTTTIDCSQTTFTGNVIVQGNTTVSGNVGVGGDLSTDSKGSFNNHTHDTIITSGSSSGTWESEEPN